MGRTLAHYLPLVALSFVAPSLCRAGVITVNSNCEEVYGYPFNLDGTYSYSNGFHIGQYVAPTSTVQTDLYYDGQDVGTIGPFTGAGNYSGSAI